jgi:hypothetical protein
LKDTNLSYQSTVFPRYEHRQKCGTVQSVLACVKAK